VLWQEVCPEVPHPEEIVASLANTSKRPDNGLNELESRGEPIAQEPKRESPVMIGRVSLVIFTSLFAALKTPVQNRRMSYTLSEFGGD